MANTLSNVMPKLLAKGLLALREAAVMPRLVATEYGDEAAQKGQTIDIPVSRAQTASDVSPGPTHASAASNTPGLVQVPLDQWKHTDFYLTDKEMAEIDRSRHFVPMQASEAVKALANSMDRHVHNQYTGIYGYVGTAGVTPFSTVATATDTRKVLNQQLAPVSIRNVVLDPSAEAQALQLAAYSDVEKTGDRAVKIEGEIGRKFGMDHFMSQNVVTHTAGTLLNGVVASTAAAGASTIDVKAASATGNLVVGDVFTIAGDSQTYVVKATVSAISSSTAKQVSIDPALQQAVSATAATATKATHVVNLGFHPQAFAFANRPLLSATQDLDGGARMVSATDPVTGLSMRLEIIRQNKQDAWDFDVLYGAKLVRPELACRIAG